MRAIASKTANETAVGQGRAVNSGFTQRATENEPRSRQEMRARICLLRMVPCDDADANANSKETILAQKDAGHPRGRSSTNRRISGVNHAFIRSFWRGVGSFHAGETSSASWSLTSARCSIGLGRAGARGGAMKDEDRHLCTSQCRTLTSTIARGYRPPPSLAVDLGPYAETVSGLRQAPSCLWFRSTRRLPNELHGLQGA